MINFNQLRDFYQVAKNLNFTIAANNLYITQPAVSAQVKLFEDYCNLKLFKKKGRKIYLTDEGEVLYDYAQKIFEYEREIDSAIEDMRKLKRGILRLGTTKTYARYFMAFLISSFHEAYPPIKIYLDEGSSLDMANSLLDFRNELAIIAKIEENPDICFIPFSQEEMLVILSPNHKLAGKKLISIRDLAREPIIMKEKGSGTRKLVSELFAKKDLTPNILMETGNTEFIKQLVQRGDGISFLVKAAVTTELKEKRLATVPLDGQKIFLDVSIAYLKDQHLSPPAQAFLDILRKLGAKAKPLHGIGTFMAEMTAHPK
jgi:DNA-binding transcriptional LysR family regulator